MITTATHKWLPGQLARARNRDWVVLPPEEPDIVRLRPIDGAEAETIGIFLPLEPDALAPTEYQLPDPESAGDFSRRPSTQGRLAPSICEVAPVLSDPWAGYPSYPVPTSLFP